MRRIAVLRQWQRLLPRAGWESRQPAPILDVRVALGIVIGLWVIFYGQGTVSALRALAGEVNAPTVALNWWDAARDIARVCAALASGVWLVALLASKYGWTKPQLGWPRPTPWRPLRHLDADIVVGGLYLLTLLALAKAVALLKNVVGGRDYPQPPPSGAAGMLADAVGSLNAGILEELVLVAVLVVALEAARLPTWVIYAVGIGVRVSFHLYYSMPGASLLLMLPFAAWATVAIGLFRWSRRIAPLIVVHTVWDLASFTGWHAGPEHRAQVVVLVLGIFGVLLALTHWVRTSRVRRPLRAALDQELKAQWADEASGRPRIDVGTGPEVPELYRRRNGSLVLLYPAALLAREPVTARARRIRHAQAHQELGHHIAPLSHVKAASRYVVGLLVTYGLLVLVVVFAADRLMWLQLVLVCVIVAGLVSAGLHLGFIKIQARRSREAVEQREATVADLTISSR